MKKIFVGLIMPIFLASCHKDENQSMDDPSRKIEGKAVDIQNGEAIKGLGVYAYQRFWVGPWNDTGYWNSETLDSTTTDENGLFSLKYFLNAHGDPDLRIEPSSIPTGYQKIVQVNDYYLCALLGDGVSVNQAYYTIKCLPRTWVRFNLAAMPPSWAADTLFLRVSSLYHNGGGACGCGDKDFSFAIQSTNELQDFQQQAWEIGYGNSVSLDYWVKGSSIKFANFIRSDCQWGDTTNVLIPF